MKHHLNDFLTQLEVTYGTSVRMDCPECGGENTFSVTNELGLLKYNCFRASCKVHGSIRGKIDATEISKLLEQVGRGVGGSRMDRYWVPPDHFVRGYSSRDCLNLLQTFRSLEAYKEDRIDIRYDPKQNRCVFLIKDQGNVVGAIGRALNGATKPKWFNYHMANQVPLVVNYMGRGSRSLDVAGVLVEDAISAARVSGVCDGIGLLGTDLHDAYVPYLVKYSTIVVALDKDASSKAVDLQRYLSYFCKDVRVSLLEKDLKYFSDEELEEWHKKNMN